MVPSVVSPPVGRCILLYTYFFPLAVSRIHDGSANRRKRSASWQPVCTRRFAGLVPLAHRTGIFSLVRRGIGTSVHRLLARADCCPHPLVKGAANVAFISRCGSYGNSPPTCVCYGIQMATFGSSVVFVGMNRSCRRTHKSCWARLDGAIRRLNK
jgi:hypothetical protein